MTENIKIIKSASVQMDKSLARMDEIVKALPAKSSKKDTKGRMGGFGLGIGGKCVCPKCGKTVAHTTGKACNSIKCPKCGTTMTREGLKKSVESMPAGIWFLIPGKRIVAAAKKEAARLRREMKDGVKAGSGHALDDGTFSDDSVQVNPDHTYKIEKLGCIARNLDQKKKYRLDEYDLRGYGL